MNNKIYDINRSISLLIEKFDKIYKSGWFEKTTNNQGECGNNFEKLIGKTNDNFQVPDFQGIEIKTKKESMYDKYITLFNLTPLGKDFFEITRLKNHYEYPDKDLRNCKVLNGDVCCENKNKLGSNYFQTSICYKNQKINLLIFNKYYRLIDNNTYWTFEMLKERIDLKLKYLAIVTIKTKKSNGKQYYKYENLDIYEYLGFEFFLNAIKKDYIRIQFKIGVFKSGKRIGQTHDRGTGFQIHEKHINSLYKKIYSNKKQ